MVVATGWATATAMGWTKATAMESELNQLQRE